jgi:hypothetical protein
MVDVPNDLPGEKVRIAADKSTSRSFPAVTVSDKQGPWKFILRRLFSGAELETKRIHGELDTSCCA